MSKQHQRPDEASLATGEGIDLNHVHLIGIGGAGMSGVARILLARGATVSGSDAKESRPLMALRAMGAHIAVGHSAENLTSAGSTPDVVVTSFAAIPADNPELVAAREAGIPIIRRSDLLALLMEDSVQVLIAGTHGKTSTTSMAVVAMQQAGLDPSFAIGGQLNKAGTNAHQGTGEVFIAEADESDASLLRYRPSIAVVTNVEPDHLDYFGTAEKYYEVFDAFADRIVPGGHLVVCLNDPGAASLGERALARGIKVVGYGTAEAAANHPAMEVFAEVSNLSTTVTGTKFTVRLPEFVGELTLSVPGEHMVLNAAAALTAGSLAGGEVSKLIEGVAGFTGVRRRFEHKGTITGGAFEGVVVVDDYAHHPTEVHAVLSAARARMDSVGSGRVITVFQPHLYSRTMEFAQEFADALSLADELVLLEIFGAREQPVEGVDSRLISNKVTVPVIYEPNFSAVAGRVAEIARPGDLVITMGAGSVTMLGDEILDTLAAQA